MAAFHHEGWGGGGHPQAEPRSPHNLQAAGKRWGESSGPEINKYTKDVRYTYNGTGGAGELNHSKTP